METREELETLSVTLNSALSIVYRKLDILKLQAQITDIASTARPEVQALFATSDAEPILKL